MSPNSSSHWAKIVIHHQRIFFFEFAARGLDWRAQAVDKSTEERRRKKKKKEEEEEWYQCASAASAHLTFQDNCFRVCLGRWATEWMRIKGEEDEGEDEHERNKNEQVETAAAAKNTKKTKNTKRKEEKEWKRKR